MQPTQAAASTSASAIGATAFGPARDACLATSVVPSRAGSTRPWSFPPASSGIAKYPWIRFCLGTYASSRCVKPKIRSVRARSQIRESNGDSSVVRWRPRTSPASASGSAQAGFAQPSTSTGTSPESATTASNSSPLSRW